MDITDREIADLLHELDDVPEPSGADGGTDVANADREPSDDDDGNGAVALPSPARPNGPSFTFRLTPDDEFETHEPVPWLIDGILPVGAEAKIVGDSGVGKSFMTVGMALAIGTGLPWLGKYAVNQGTVVYILAEGKGGFPKRVRAWKVFHRIEGYAGVRFVEHAVQMNGRGGGQVNQLVRDINAQLSEPPVLIVIDTQNRCMEGKDENSSKDLSDFLAAVARLREEFGAAVLIVHHTGWDGARERGHSAQRGAADTVMLLERAHKDDSLTRDPVRLRCLKQKDAAEFEDIDVIAQPVPLGNDPDGKPQSSFVLTLTGADRPLSTEENAMTTKEQEYRTTIEDMLAFACEGPVGPEELRRLTGIPNGTLYTLLPKLADAGRIVRVEGKRGNRYTARPEIRAGVARLRARTAGETTTDVEPIQ